MKRIINRAIRWYLSRFCTCENIVLDLFAIHGEPRAIEVKYCDLCGRLQTQDKVAALTRHAPVERFWHSIRLLNSPIPGPGWWK
jgi:hypothetical protein